MPVPLISIFALFLLLEESILIFKILFLLLSDAAEIPFKF
jgi:hypothetical protein